MTDIWTRLQDYRKSQGDLRIETLFHDDGTRADAFATHADGLVFDWSKTLIDQGALRLLLELAAPVPAHRDAMFAG
ncbi:MAG TPA: glucose-6-phosphate isomerase, partial [Paracoccus sp. (in: a-proteobacteria)]|nr:glucose-6-phosphate isomerase [Paracoccus sp. (in: a-proteobacteria)]